MCSTWKGELNTNYKDIKEYFNVHQDIKPSLYTLRDAVVSIRTAKLPDPRVVGTVGSFFKNPLISNEKYRLLKVRYPELPGFPIGKEYTKIPLAWVLDHVCGLKGTRRNNVGLHEKQPLALVHYGGGNAKEIKKFAEWIRENIKEKTGIVPEFEVSFIGNYE